MALAEVEEGEANRLLIGDVPFDLDVGDVPVALPEVGLLSQQRIEPVRPIPPHAGHRFG